MHNPLLTDIIYTPKIDFTWFNKKFLNHAFNKLINSHKKELELFNVTSQTNLTWDILFESNPSLNKIQTLWSILNSIKDDINQNDIEIIYKKYFQKINTLFLHNNIDEQYCYQLNEYTKTKEYFNLPDNKKNIVQDIKNIFIANGALLTEDKKKYIHKLNKSLHLLEEKFKYNLEMHHYELSILFKSIEDLEGLNINSIKAAKKFATENKLKGYLLTYDSNLMINALSYCHKESTRKKIYTKINELARIDPYDNTEICNMIVAVKHELAQLRNYKTHAEFILTQSMAQKTESIYQFLNDLGNKVLPLAIKEQENLFKFGSNLLGRQPEHWDNLYIQEQYQKQELNIDTKKFNQYFNTEHTIQRIFELVSYWFDIKFIKSNFSTWHPEIQTYTITDIHDNNLGYIYFDIYEREGKLDDPLVQAIVSRHIDHNTQNLPIAYLKCSLENNTDYDSCMNLHDIKTFFHELGHALHHVLSQEDNSLHSSIESVSIDFCEMPSIFLEHFTNNYYVLQYISQHTITNEKLPLSLFDNIMKLKNNDSTYIIEEIVLSELDLVIHDQKNNLVDIDTLQKNIFDKWNIIKYDPNISFYQDFSHIFVGGYDAGYYSYNWSELYSCNAIQEVQLPIENNIQLLDNGTNINKNSMLKFKKEILEKSGSKHPSIMYKNFSSKKVSITNFLEVHKLT